MKLSFDDIIVPSFTLFIDNVLTSIGQGYTNNSGFFYPATDKRIANFNIYASPFRSFVADSSVAGATIPSGVYDNNNNFLTRNSGIIFDFQNGRVFTTGNYPALSGNYAFKDFTVKYTNQSEENIIFNDVYKLQPQYNTAPNTGIDGDVTTVPVVFIKYEPGTDVPYTFGAEFRDNQASFRCVLLSDNSSLLDSAMGLLRDQTEKIVAISSPANLPYTYYGDLKSGYYNYNNVINNQTGYFFIKSVNTLKFTEAVNILIGRNLWGGFADFQVSTYRNRNQIL